MNVPEYLENVRSECGMTREEAARVPPETVQLLVGLALRIAIADDMPALMRKAWTQALDEAKSGGRVGE